MYKLNKYSHALVRSDERNLDFKKILSEGVLYYSDKHYKAVLAIDKDIIILNIVKDKFITTLTTNKNCNSGYKYMIMMEQMEIYQTSQKDICKTYNHDIIVIEWKLNHICKQYFGVERTPSNKNITNRGGKHE